MGDLVTCPLETPPGERDFHRTKEYDDGKHISELQSRPTLIGFNCQPTLRAAQFVGLAERAMLAIREEQMQVLSQYMESRFIQRTVEHLRTDFEAQIRAQGLAEDRLKVLVCDHIATARQHGIRNRGDLTTYIECIAYLGPRFDTDDKHPFVRETLARDDLVADEKMDRISEYLIFAVEGSDWPEGHDPVPYRFGEDAGHATQSMTFCNRHEGHDRRQA